MRAVFIISSILMVCIFRTERNEEMKKVSICKHSTIEIDLDTIIMMLNESVVSYTITDIANNMMVFLIVEDLSSFTGMTDLVIHGCFLDGYTEFTGYGVVDLPESFHLDEAKESDQDNSQEAISNIEPPQDGADLSEEDSEEIESLDEDTDFTQDSEQDEAYEDANAAHDTTNEDVTEDIPYIESDSAKTVQTTELEGQDVRTTD
jgi:hypothetical protein